MLTEPLKYFSCRLPVEIYNWLKQQAANNRRSMRAELVCLLEQMKETSKKA